MDTVEVLIRARALVEKGWTQGAAARDALGQITGPALDCATSWCAIGAISRETTTSVECDEAIEAVAEAIHTGSLMLWNDAPGRTQSEVLAAFDRAIAATEAAT